MSDHYTDPIYEEWIDGYPEFSWNLWMNTNDRHLEKMGTEIHDTAYFSIFYKDVIVEYVVLIGLMVVMFSIPPQHLMLYFCYIFLPGVFLSYHIREKMVADNLLSEKEMRDLSTDWNNLYVSMTQGPPGILQVDYPSTSPEEIERWWRVVHLHKMYETYKQFKRLK